MKYRRLGRTALQVSELCLGTMNFGPQASEPESFAILDLAAELGINFIDTANQYGGHLGVGVSEVLVGKWLAQDPVRRDRIVLATKVYEPMSSDINDRGLSARHIQMACDASLKRLQVDHIDLYQFHHIDRIAPFEEVWQACLRPADCTRQNYLRRVEQFPRLEDRPDQRADPGQPPAGIGLRAKLVQPDRAKSRA